MELNGKNKNKMGIFHGLISMSVYNVVQLD